MSGKEIHEHQKKIKNNNCKKRRTNEDGKYKTVLQREVEERDGKEKHMIEEEDKVVSRKRLKPNTPRKILGGVTKGMELAKEVDWQKRREEIIERMNRDE